MNVLSQIYAVGCPPPPFTEQMNNPLHRLPVCRVNIVPHELNPIVAQSGRCACALRTGAPGRRLVAPKPVLQHPRN